MTRELRRATFNRSALVRVLSASLPEAADPTYDFGERLGQWLDFSDALMLFSVLNTEAGQRMPLPSAEGDLPEQLTGLRRKLGDAIRYDGIFRLEPTGSAVHNPFPVPRPGDTAEDAADFSPYHRYYLAHQRDMGTAIAALRGKARQVLADRSAAGRQLAGLDAAFEKSLAGRERNLLANVPILIGKRFAQRYAEHCAALPDNAVDDPLAWRQAGSWLEAFCHDIQAALLAELELRLKPVVGLITALRGGEPKETISQ